MSDRDALPSDFSIAAAPAPERVTVSLDLDADVLAWLKQQPTAWDREINNLARFFMDTCQNREPDDEPDAWQPGQPPARPIAGPEF